MANETRFTSAITAGTAVPRDFKTLATNLPFSYRTELEVENRHATATLLLVVMNGPVERIAPLMTKRFIGQVYYYTVDSTANVAATDYTIYERGGLDEFEESPATDTDTVAA